MCVLFSQGKYKPYAVVALVDQYSDYISNLRELCPAHGDQSCGPGYFFFTWIQTESISLTLGSAQRSNIPLGDFQVSSNLSLRLTRFQQQE